jgi:hypothetical protein
VSEITKDVEMTETAALTAVITSAAQLALALITLVAIKRRSRDKEKKKHQIIAVQ